MNLSDLPKEALVSGQRVTLLFHAHVQGFEPHDRIVHVTTQGFDKKGFNTECGAWSRYEIPGSIGPAHFILYKRKGQRVVVETNIDGITRIRPGWLTLEEMTE